MKAFSISGEGTEIVGESTWSHSCVSVSHLQLTVNEAAAQLCVKDNALLTRRDELFALARQISREVTYKYTYRTTK